MQHYCDHELILLFRLNLQLEFLFLEAHQCTCPRFMWGHLDGMYAGVDLSLLVYFMDRKDWLHDTVSYHRRD